MGLILLAIVVVAGVIALVAYRKHVSAKQAAAIVETAAAAAVTNAVSTAVSSVNSANTN